MPHRFAPSHRLSRVLTLALAVQLCLVLGGCQTLRSSSSPQPAPDQAGATGSTARPAVPPPVNEWPYAEAAPAPDGAKVHQRIQRVSFDTGSTALSSESRGALALSTDALATNPRWHLVLVGSGDSVSESATADKLGTSRAEAVKKFLTGKGIDGSRISVMSVGAKYAKGDRTSPEARARDRAVEVWAFLPK